MLEHSTKFRGGSYPDHHSHGISHLDQINNYPYPPYCGNCIVVQLLLVRSSFA